MTDIFEQLNKQVKENEERWKQIEELYAKMKEFLSNPNKTSADEIYNPILSMMKLILLLTDQMRPMASAGKQVEEISKEITDMLSNFGSKK